MTLAGLAHLTVGREDFRAQVPSWVPFVRTSSSSGRASPRWRSVRLFLQPVLVAAAVYASGLPERSRTRR